MKAREFATDLVQMFDISGMSNMQFQCMIDAVEAFALQERRRGSEMAREAAAKIADGNYDRPVAIPYAKDGKPHKGDKCPHGFFTWDDCEACVANAIRAMPIDVTDKQGETVM